MYLYRESEHAGGLFNYELKKTSDTTRIYCMYFLNCSSSRLLTSREIILSLKVDIHCIKVDINNFAVRYQRYLIL